MKSIIIGAGIAGLASAIRLRLLGFEVQVFESAAGPGGKLSEIRGGEFRWDAGPSLFTMPQLVEELFELAGLNTAEHFEYSRLPVVTNYFYEDGTRIEAHSTAEAFAEEIHQKTGEAKKLIFQQLKESEELYDITNHVFLERSLHKLSTYFRKDTVISALQLHKLKAFSTMHGANNKRFKDPRVVQLFDRYATYNGSDPYQAPATLNIIPHLEFGLGAYFPKGGMFAITQAIYKLGQKLGVEYHFNSPVDRILHQNGQAIGIHSNGAEHRSDIVVSNADVVPTYRRLLSDIKPPEKTLKQPRSSSALIFYWGLTQDYPELDVHNIFFSGDYQEEFRQIWKVKQAGSDPTVYINITSRMNEGDAPEGGENWFVMINVPANVGQDWDAIIAESRERIIVKLERMLGKAVRKHISTEQILDPRTIESRTSSYQGALYGSSSNNPFAAFLRHPNFTRRLGGLYFCGGSVHPGGGIPLSLLSAKIMTACIQEDLGLPME